MTTTTVEHLNGTRARGTVDDTTLEVCCLADHEAGQCQRAARESWLHGLVHVVERADAPPLLIPGCDHLNDATVTEAVRRYRLHQVA